MHFKTMQVTPEQARNWLKGNKQNRAVRKAYVKTLAEAMQRGEWTPTHQPVALVNGRLLDGQHRLMAVIESGLERVPMTVAFDVPSETFNVIDIGAKRSHADIYGEDMHVMHPISLIGKLVYQHNPTPREVQPVYLKFHRQIRELVAMYNRGTRGLTSAAIKVGALASILDGEDKAYVHNLFRKITNFDTDGLPRVAQLFLKQVSLSGPGRKVTGANRYQMMIRAWIVFHEANAEFEKLAVKDTTARLAQIRKVFMNALGMKS